MQRDDFLLRVGNRHLHLAQEEEALLLGVVSLGLVVRSLSFGGGDQRVRGGEFVLEVRDLRRRLGGQAPRIRHFGPEPRDGDVQPVHLRGASLRGGLCGV